MGHRYLNLPPLLSHRDLQLPRRRNPYSSPRGNRIFMTNCSYQLNPINQVRDPNLSTWVRHAAMPVNGARSHRVKGTYWDRGWRGCCRDRSTICRSHARCCASRSLSRRTGPSRGSACSPCRGRLGRDHFAELRQGRAIRHRRNTSQIGPSIALKGLHHANL